MAGKMLPPSEVSDECSKVVPPALNLVEKVRKTSHLMKYVPEFSPSRKAKHQEEGKKKAAE